jgi:hypothetical protein
LSIGGIEVDAMRQQRPHVFEVTYLGSHEQLLPRRHSRMALPLAYHTHESDDQYHAEHRKHDLHISALLYL